MPARILIAEDDDLQGAVLRAALENEGYEADIVTDGLEAVRRLRLGGYDLALIDYHMPVVNGLAAARLLHDFVGVEGRPRLVAITAGSEGLCDPHEVGGTRAFDAVVSKTLGLPTLMAAIGANLKLAAEAKAVTQTARQSLTRRDRAATRRRRWLSPLAAVPALLMAAAFLAAFGWARTSLQRVDDVSAATQRTELLGGNAASLQAAAQKAETSQKVYLATGAAADRLAFIADAQSVDQLLVSSMSLNPEGTPGFGAAVDARASIERWVQALVAGAKARPEVDGAIPATAPAAGPGDGVGDPIGLWASKLVDDSRQVVFGALLAARHNVALVLVVLGAGVVYGVWNAARAVLRRWHPARPDGVGAGHAGATIEHAWDAPRHAALARPASGTALRPFDATETAT